MHSDFLDGLRILYKIEEGFFSRQNGVGKTRWRYLKSNNERAVVMFVHGTGNDHLFLAYDLFQCLLAFGYSVFTFDLDGHGAESTTTYSNATILDCVTDAYNNLCSIYDPKMVHILGNSLGGNLAAYAMAKDGLKASSLLLLGTPDIVNIKMDSIYTEALTAISKDFPSYIQRWGFKAAVPAVGAFNRERYPIRLDSTDGAFSYVTAVEDLTDEINIVEKLMLFPAKILNIFGTMDRIAPISNRTGECKLVNCNHFLLTANTEVFTVITDWLESLPDAPAIDSTPAS